MDYEINRNRKGLYLPKLEHWVHDSFGLDLVEANIYNLILHYEVLTWNSDYIASCVYCSKSTVLRIIERLCKKDLIRKILIPRGNNKKWILVAVYTEKGRRTEEEISELSKKGYKKMSLIQRRKELSDTDNWFRNQINSQQDFDSISF